MSKWNLYNRNNYYNNSNKANQQKDCDDENLACDCGCPIGPQGPAGETGQLMLTLDGEDLSYTVFGRATGASQIVGMALVTTTVTNSILTVRNPAGNATALTITPLAGGTRPVSAHLVIMQIG